jgi:anaerobic ribonucleoside-triphosphate reductase
LDLLEFFKAVDDSPELQGVTVSDPTDSKEDPVFVVLHKPTGYFTRLYFNTVLAHDWEALNGIMTNRREPNPIIHMARVVGYYSRVENWNKSKLGELTDRHKGDYTPEEPKE